LLHQSPHAPGKNVIASGEMFGRYRIRGVLEEGGMGRLYVAERTGVEGFTKVVALKRILPHLAHDPKLREMFIAEARVAARLDHPDIVTTFELGEVDGNFFMSMEYLPGEDLAKILSRCTATRPMPVEIAVTLAQRVADALHYAHELPDDDGYPAMLVHRDVNPCNIVLTYYGAVKLLDFGVAKETAASSTTFSGVFRGNYAYCAPEQIEGTPVDRRTDIFCLGIVLWECVTGYRLFGGGTDVSNIDAVRSKRIEPPSTLRSEVPPALDAIVMRCLSRDPARRYQRASDVSASLRQLLSSREHAPNEQGIGTWLEQQFGSERASRKKAIGQGTDIEAALAYLQVGTGVASAISSTDHESPAGGNLTRPSVLWSTTIRRTPGTSRSVEGPSTPPLTATVPTGSLPPRTSGIMATATANAMAGARSAHTPTPARVDSVGVSTSAGGMRPSALRSPAAAPPPESSLSTAAVVPGVIPQVPTGPVGTRRVLVIAAATLAIGGLAIGGAALLSRAGAPAATPLTTAAALGSLDIRSDPQGAQILVDGSPSGRVTPAILSGLPVGRAVRVELSKDGYGATAVILHPESERRAPHVVKLVQTGAVVRLVDLPRRASVFLDGVQVDPGGSVDTTVGRHELRVEVKEKIVFEKVLDVRPGVQTMSVASGAGAP
jgi:serine/threonine protein kinase